MALKEDFERTGNLFFRWRSYLPLFMTGLFLLALLEYRYRANPHRLDLYWGLGCLCLSLAGLILRFFTVGFVPAKSSGRNTRAQVADSLNTTGMYAMVRNPIYLGNFIIWFGLSLWLQSWWLTALIILFFTVFYERIIFAEESFLREKFGETFLSWARETPAIIPKLSNWQPPDLPFSWRSAISREYSTFFAIIASYTILQILSCLILEGKLGLDTTWLIIFLLGAVIYAAIRTLKKKTKILTSAGR
jgi:protein-S-isoprenylcysteine O-methyltransferase Ste14